MKSAPRILLAFLLAACCAAGLAYRPLTAGQAAGAAQTSAPPGQSSTRLPDGRWLLIGGEGERESAPAAIYDPASGRTRSLNGLAQPRAWHTATVLADGTVLVVGGRARDGQPATAVEVFDPATASFFQLSAVDVSPRSGHSATLLTDGRVLLVGGLDANSTVRADAELWSLDPAGASPVAVNVVSSQMRGPRAYHRATLQADGSVLIDDATTAGRRAEAFDPATAAFAPAAPPAARPRIDAIVVAESRPADGAIDVAENTRLVIRFSGPLASPGANAEGTTLTGPSGDVPVRAVLAESGRLLFISPQAPMASDSDYVLRLPAFADEHGQPVAIVPIAFTTRRDPGAKPPAARDEEAWVPDADSLENGWRSGRPDSPWRQLPPRLAPEGVTALAGQVLRLDGLPLPDVTLQVGAEQTETDRTGRFLLTLPDVPTGRIEMLIDGRTANRARRTYGLFEVGVPMTAGRTTVLPYTVWMPLLDTTSRVRIPSPTTQEVVVTTPRIPGLELHLPAGTVIRDHDGKVVRELTITPIPLDRPPFALPSIEVPVYFTIQPGGAYVHTYGAGTKGAWLVYPNGPKGWAGKRMPFYHYEPEEKGWYVYGLGTVTANRAQVVPDASTRLYEFSGAMINTGQGPPADAEPPGDCCGNDGDPVNLTTGLFELEQTDLSLPDVLPIALTRTYRTRDLDVRPFGIGTTHAFGLLLWSANAYQEADLVLPDGGRIHYVRTSPGTGFIDAVFEHKETATTSATPTGFYKSTLSWNAGGWDLRLTDGTVYVFGDVAPLQAIRDRYGNTIRLTWSLTNGAGSGYGNLLQLTSPNGRWIRFTYDGSNRIIEAKDPIGRTVGYTYDAQGRLWKVTDPLNQITEYTYDTDHRMLTVKNRSGVVVVTNEYTTAADTPTPVGWVKKQTFADGGTYQFGYTVVNGKSTQTDVTNPRGFVRRVTFNNAGYTLTDRRALNQSEEQLTSSVRPSANNFITTTTDAHGDQASTTYDASGNVTSVTRLAGTANATTISYTYEPAFHQVATVTDPLNHTTTFTHDDKGNVTSITDPLQHQTTFTYNGKGQALSVTDALQHTTTFGYLGGDLVSITDPLNRVSQRFVDGIGRVVEMVSPRGTRTRYTYDANRQVKTMTDHLSGETSFDHFPDGHLKGITDANQHTTNYAYDTMGRMASRTDPLQSTETFGYDAHGNPTVWTDRKGQVTTRSYDALNRLTQVAYPDGSTIGYTYDVRNRVTAIVDSASGTIARAFDDLDRLTSETTPQGTIDYTYDAADRRASMTVTGQPTVTYSYDAANRITGITRGTSNVTMSYDDANRRTSVTLPNGMVTEYSHDPASQLTSLTYRQNQTVLGDLSFAYDAAGRRSTASGTWARTGLPMPLASAMYNAANELTSWGAETWTYDANGGLVSDGLTSYAWNGRQRLSAMSGATTAGFTYDGTGRRTSKTVGGQTTSFLYDGLNAVQELSSGAPVANRLMGLSIDQAFGRTTAAGTSWDLLDGLGSPVAESDATGLVQSQFTYEPFGRLQKSGPATDNTFLYTGREDDTTGLYFYRARFYNPSAQRFVSEDPLQFASGSQNYYEYSRSDPVNRVDPLGLVSWDCEYSLGGITEVVGGAYFVSKCVSECVNRRRVSATVAGTAVSAGAGLIPVTIVKSSLTLKDPLSYPDASSIEGKLVVATAGAALGPVGYSYTQIILGQANGQGPGWQEGLDAGFGLYLGAVALLRSRTEDCCN